MYDLECTALTKYFGKMEAVKNVSFSIPSGSFFSILGPSGSGKTTLMRMIAGFEEPSSGDIKIKEKSVVHVPPNKRNVKMVFQHLALFPMMNVSENIAYGLRCKGVGRGEIKRRVGEVLERIGLPDVGRKQVNHLSGGQRQRIAIARCMVLEPDVLLLDEPLGALDLKLRERMKVELKLLQHQFETTFLYITHDQSEALVMSDQVAVMNDGCFEQIGSPESLYHAPQTPFVAGFVGDSNRWSGRIADVHETGTVTLDVGGSIMLQGTNRSDGALKVGDMALVFSRPEHIQAISVDSGPTDADSNSLPGVVDSILFNGASSRILVRTQNGELVQATPPNASEFNGLRPSQSVRLRWAVDKTAVFANRAN